MKTVTSARITTIVDNDVWKRGLASSWGLSFHAEMSMKDGRNSRILMDVGGSFQAFYKNCSRLDINLSEIEGVFISHWHGDHYGALSHVLPMIGRSIPVYVPSPFSSGMKEVKAADENPVVCFEPTTIMEGLMSTGKMPTGIGEHSLIINVEDKGLVVLTGCGHPGIINILKRAQEVSAVDRIYGVMGGFHISGVNAGMRLGEFLEELKVEVVGPCHCTGQDARKGIARVIEDKCVKMGSGKTITTS